MMSIPRRSSLVVVALTSILVGVLVGSSVAWAHTGDTPKQTGETTYTVRHEGCLGYKCNYRHSHSTEEYDDWTGFIIHDTSYSDGGQNDGLVFAYMYIWDEYGEHRRRFSNFHCDAIDGIDRTEYTRWAWGGHDPQTTAQP